MWTGLSGAALATMIRLELAHPGSPFFKGDSLRYLQVITAHGLIMVFFVVVPLIFGGFANFFIPYHIGAKDVAFPRLNSIGFWIQPCGFILVAKISYIRPTFWNYYDKSSNYFLLLEKNKFLFFFDKFFYNNSNNKINWDLKLKEKTSLNNNFYFLNPVKFFLWKNILSYSETFLFLINRISKNRRKKLYFSKCSNRTLTTAGWTFITPFSSNFKYTGLGAQDLLLVSVIFAGISSTVSFTNLLITRRTLSMPGIRNRRILLPFFTIGILFSLRMLSVITPVLAAAMIMMLLDRHWQTTFFDFSYGGDPILSQHLFWFFGHPEVYVLIIPTFGIINMIIPFSNNRRLASKHHMIWAIYVMGYMGFIVWGHHMYLVGLDHRSRTMYSTITILISMPATIKVVNWTLSLINGALRFDVHFLAAISYIFLFLVAGFTGMWLSHVGLNISMHDTFYVVAHFHLMLSGTAMMGIFAGFYYYFSVIFCIKYSQFFGYLHVIYYSGGQWLTFLPQFYLGFAGMPRRIHDYPIIFLGWQSMSTCGHFITLVGIIFFFFMFIDSYIYQKVFFFTNFGISRFNKRMLFYLFKVKFYQKNSKNLQKLPNYIIQKIINNKKNFFQYYYFK